MIAGVGVDVVRHARVARVLARYGERFVRRFLAPDELVQFAALHDDAARVRFAASRWAAKEAIFKAMPAHSHTQLAFRAVHLQRDALTGKLCVRLDPPHGTDALAVHVSISHEEDVSVAFAVADARPPT